MYDYLKQSPIPEDYRLLSTSMEIMKQDIRRYVRIGYWSFWLIALSLIVRLEGADIIEALTRVPGLIPAFTIMIATIVASALLLHRVTVDNLTKDIHLYIRRKTFDTFMEHRDSKK